MPKPQKARRIITHRMIEDLNIKKTTSDGNSEKQYKKRGRKPKSANNPADSVHSSTLKTDSSEEIRARRGPGRPKKTAADNAVTDDITADKVTNPKAALIGNDALVTVTISGSARAVFTALKQLQP